DTRASSWCRTSPSGVTFGASTLPAQLARREAGDFCAAAVSSTISDSVFQAPHSAHWPCHLLCSPPHSPQTYATFALTALPAVFIATLYRAAVASGETAGAGSTRTHSRYISYSVDSRVIAAARPNQGRATSSAPAAAKIANGSRSSSVTKGAAW